MKTGIVEKVIRLKRPVYKIIFDDGRSIVCTGKHPWLSKKVATDCKWRTIEGNKKLNVGTYVRWVTKPWEDSTAEDGWFGGVIDGEGSLGKTHVCLGISQLPGGVWERIVKYCSEKKYNFGIEIDDRKRKGTGGFSNRPVMRLELGRMNELFQIIGQTRPTRFIDKHWWDGRELPGKRTGIGWAKIVSIDFIGAREVVDLQTSEGTYIAEGFVSHNTTYGAIDMLDDVLWTPNTDGIFIAQDLDTAKDIFDNKVFLSWANFPPKIKGLFYVDMESARRLKVGFGDGSFSSMTVDSTGRAGTFQSLHITEFAKIALEFPDRAREIISGSIPAIPRTGKIIIESTSQGAKGIFHDMFMEAYNRGEVEHELQFKAHFYNWQWDEEIDTLLPMDVPSEFLDYKKKYNLNEREITYYYQKFQSLGGDWDEMNKEYPTTIEEAFNAAVKGAYYADVVMEARRSNRITEVPYKQGWPVRTWWDLGMSDSTVILFFQKVGMEWRWFDYYENSGESFEHYAEVLQKKGYVYGEHYAPHDIEHESLQTGHSLLETARRLGIRFKVVPKLDINEGIQAVRRRFRELWIDEDKCKNAIDKISLYRKKWDDKRGEYMSKPYHDSNSHVSDALRYWAVTKENESESVRIIIPNWKGYNRK